MKNLSRFVMGVLVFALMVFSMGFVAGEVIAQKKIDLIKQRVPNQWWQGGWDEEANLEEIISDKQSGKDQKAQAQYYLAGQYYANRDFNRALQEYRKLISTYPAAWFESQKAQFEIGQIYLYRLNEPEAAIYEYQKAIDEYQTTYIKALAQMMIGRAYRRQKQFDTALKEYKKVLEIYPDFHSETTEANLDIGDMYLEQAFSEEIKDKEKQEYIKASLAAYKKAFQLCPFDNSEFMERILDSIHRAFRCLDMNLARANQFVKFQKHGKSGPDGVEGTTDDLSDPLEDI
ncbi:MAG: tetratricopeptide repeat protein [Candidatus Omnitrophica bacterium]|nr:tetratricopeptide repeat protein [Candidatus Omnitrophota bacterium]